MAPDLFRVFIDTGDEAPVEFSSVLNVVDMPYNPVTDQQISGLGQVPSKAEGTQFAFDEPILGGTKAYTAQPFGLAIEFTWEAWRDELYGVFQEMVRELRRASDNRLEVAAWTPFNNAESATAANSGFTATEALISTSHTRLDAGTAQSNRPNPDAQFSFTTVQQAMRHFHNLVDERGIPRLMAPSMALVTPEFYHDAREILGSSGRPLSTDNEINALIQDDLGWMVTHYITTTSKWFIMVRQGVHDVNFFVRDAPMFDMFDDPRTKNAVATVYQRHIAGWGTWKGIFGSTG
jgi:hypothetical protein